MIECALTVSHIRNDEAVYAGDALFSTDDNDQSSLATVVMECLSMTILGMEAHATRDDYKRIDQKGIDVTIVNGEKTAQFCLRHNRGSNPVDAADALMDWLHGDIVKGVIE
jgi:hypothetical protein